MPEGIVWEELETGHVSRESCSFAPDAMNRNTPRNAP
jgi:hypothetical protein